MEVISPRENTQSGDSVIMAFTANRKKSSCGETGTSGIWESQINAAFMKLSFGVQILLSVNKV
jgi:hypothetical protein